MQRVPVPIIADSDIDVTLGGVRYILNWQYTGRDGRWRLHIKDSEGVYVVKGLKMIEDFSPTAHLYTIDFQEGMLNIVELNADDLPAGRDNLGINKNYEVIFTTFAELEG